MSSLLEEWRKDNSFSPEELVEEDIPLQELGQEVGDWGEERKLNFILDVLNGEDRKRNNSFGDKLTIALKSVVRLKRANRLHRQKLGYQDKEEA